MTMYDVRCLMYDVRCENRMFGVQGESIRVDYNRCFKVLLIIMFITGVEEF
jgi:hypothetical protein